MPERPNEENELPPKIDIKKKAASAPPSLLPKQPNANGGIAYLDRNNTPEAQPANQEAKPTMSSENRETARPAQDTDKGTMRSVMPDEKNSGDMQSAPHPVVSPKPATATLRTAGSGPASVAKPILKPKPINESQSPAKLKTAATATSTPEAAKLSTESKPESVSPAGNRSIKLPDDASSGKPPAVPAGESKPPSQKATLKPKPLAQAIPKSEGTAHPASPPVHTAPENNGKDSSEHKVPAPSATAPESTEAEQKPYRPSMRPSGTPQTIKLKKPVPMGIKRDVADATAASGTKRATSKLSLPTATGEIDEKASGVKTITIAPRADSASRTGNIAQMVDAATGSENSNIDPKRQTSRISLESAYSGSDSSATPKTIKLKRPSEAPTVKAPSSATTPAEGAENTNAEPDTLADDGETQKKTIKVKRPSARPSVQRSAAAGNAGQSSAAPMPVGRRTTAEDSAHWIFIASAAAAIVISGLLIYVMLAQVIGPNVSLTPYSYGANNMEIPWPGRVSER